MPDPGPALAPWAAFYTIVGSAAAALTGLMFVVITLVTGERNFSTRDGIATFSTPTVLHFSAALLVALLLGAPWHSFVAPSVLIGIVGLYGIVHIVQVMLRTRRLHSYEPDVEDWVCYTILPFAAYLTILAGAAALLVMAEKALFVIASGTALLVFVGIRNSWDTVTFIAIDTGETKASEAKHDS
ncbi:MAG: hypothetical protein IAI48_09005 [Candidatus Eremiobacteraeota bacterium]|nr:hypothetical protein [Candidatus Eremiobacteraeota bacterium]